MKYLFFLLLMVVAGFQLNAQQQQPCGVDEIIREQIGKPEYELWHKEFEKTIQHIIKENRGKNGSRNIITIPVVVHVLYCDAVPEANILNERIVSQLEVLNQDYNKLNPRIETTHPFYKSNAAADFDIQFCLASRNPDGGPTTGIIRKKVPNCNFIGDLSGKWLTELEGSKQWDPLHYLNLYVVPEIDGSTIGLNLVPGSTNEFIKDGPVIEYIAFGIGSELPTFNLGVAASHEIGHWMSLIHTFGVNPCSSDEVDDTPVQAGAQFNCPQGEVEGCTFNGILESGTGLRNVRITDDNNILFGTQNSGFRYKFGNFPSELFLQDYQIRDIEIDQSGLIWIAAGKEGALATAGGVYIFEPTTNQSSLVENNFFSNSDGLNSRFVNDISIDENNDAWIANGQSLTAGNTDQGDAGLITVPFYIPQATACYPQIATDIRFLISHRDKINQVTYFGVDKSCNNGCDNPYIIKLQNGVCTNLILDDIVAEFGNNFLIRGITTDDQGRVWVGFNSGIGIKVFDNNSTFTWRINPNNSTAFSVGEAVNRNTMFTLNNNDIYVGAGNGLIVFHADSLQNAGDESTPELFTKVIPTALHPSITSNSVTGVDVRGDRLVFCTATQLIDAYRPYKHGTMTNNIMNYNKDECIALLTEGQKERALALFDPVNGFRKEMLSSDGCSAPTCGCPVTYLAKATGITKNKATINWDANTCASTFKVFYKDLITNIEKVVTVNAPAISTTLTGLVPGHDYEVQLKTFCSGNTPANSIKSNIIKFLTISSCEAPSNLQAIFTAANKLVVNWESVSGAVQYRIQYKKAGTDNWQTVAVNSSACCSKNIIDQTFEVGVAYQVRIRTKCTSNTFSPFSSEITVNNINRMDELVADEETDPILENPITIYPNPNKGRFNLYAEHWNYSTCNVVITDIVGKLLYYQNVSVEEGIIDREVVLDHNLPSGVYLIKLYEGHDMRHGKIVIQ